MSRALAIGNELRLGGYALAGVNVRHAPSPAEVEAAWAALDEKTALLVLTREAHAVLAARLGERDDLIWAVVPS